MKKLLIVIAFLCACNGTNNINLGVTNPNQFLPDSSLTPGAVDPTKTVQVLCAPGYSTRLVRPPVSYTDHLKIQQMRLYNRTGTTRDYEEDHLVPLEIGGNPTDPKNLWPEPWAGQYGAHVKDTVENAAKRAVCKGSISLPAAQSGFESNWILLGQKLGVIT
jgi:hypothetical protein